ncbi:cellulose binding domain-containing protein [Actinoplanes sp. NPDC049599]|uniref:cellulose binding domain-containing protein n=1 Tax=Actinoplanes sp. NPDC049599 TaxID=3363903 RepID=UPI0037AEC3EA
MRTQRRRTGLAVAASALCLAAGGLTTAATARAAAAGCRVTYTIGAQWAGGFTANVTLTNLGDPVTGWTLRWSFGGGQTVTQAWNATATQSGSAVSVTNVSWNGSLATNGSTSFGFNGALGAVNPAPTSFTLNGVACTGGVTDTPSTPPPGTPPVRTVRVFWLKPSDVAFDQRYPTGITGVMVEAQRFFKQQLGKTFTLNSPTVEVVNGLHDTNWYINNNCTPGGDRYACVIFNMQGELQQRFGLSNPDSRWLMVAEASAEEVGRSGGGAQPGWVLLSGHDADGAAGKTEPMPRWYGGMVHELGHAFGLPDATSTDGTCMSASFYGYPNCTFSQSQKNGILNGPYGSFLS